MEKWIQERYEIDERRWSSFPNYEERAREIKRNIQKEKKTEKVDWKEQEKRRRHGNLLGWVQDSWMNTVRHGNK